MRPSLDEDGYLIPPTSREGGVERVKQLRHEVAKIEEQLAGPQCRADRFEWRGKAHRKLNQFRDEEKQIRAWLMGWKAATDAGEPLLKQAYDKLQDLELEVDFSEKDNAFMDALDEHFAPVVLARRIH